MEKGKVQEALVSISLWYLQARGAHSPTTLEALYEVLTERVYLYRCRPPKGLRVPIFVPQLYIEDGIPTESEVETAVKGLKGVRAGGPSVIRTEGLKGWLWEAMRKKEPVRRRW